MEDDSSSEIISSSVINSPIPTSSLPSFLWYQYKKSHEDNLSIEETEFEFVEPDQGTDCGSPSLLFQQNPVISLSTIVDAFQKKKQDLLTESNVYANKEDDHDDDDTQSTASEVLVSVNDLMHYSAVEKALNGLCMPEKQSAKVNHDLQNGCSEGIFVEDPSQPQVQCSVRDTAKEPQVVMSNSQVEEEPRAHTCSRFNTDSKKSLSESNDLKFNDHNYANCSELLMSRHTQSSVNGNSAVIICVPTEADVVPPELQVSSDPRVTRVHLIHEFELSHVKGGDTEETEISIDENDKKQLKEILKVEQLLNDVKNNLEDYGKNKNVTLKLLRDAQLILQRLHLQQSEETKNVEKQIKSAGKRRTECSLLLYKGRLLKARCSRLQTVSDTFKELHEKSVLLSMNSQFSADEIDINQTFPNTEHQEVVCASVDVETCPSEEIDALDPTNGAVINLASNDQCHLNGMLDLTGNPQFSNPCRGQNLPFGTSTFEVTQQFHCCSGVVPVRSNDHLIEIGALDTMQASGIRSLNSAAESQIQVDLEKTLRENYPKKMNFSGSNDNVTVVHSGYIERNISPINSAQMNGMNDRCVVQLQFPVNCVTSNTSQKPSLVTSDSQRIISNMCMEVSSDAAPKTTPVPDFSEAQFIPLPTYFQTPSFYNTDSISQFQMNLQPAEHFIQTAAMKPTFYGTQQRFMTVAENFPSNSSYFQHQKLIDHDLTSAISLIDHQQHKNSTEYFVDSMWVNVPLVNDLNSRTLVGFQNDTMREMPEESQIQDGSQLSVQEKTLSSRASFKQLFDEGLIRPGNNVLTLKCKDGQIAASVTENCRIKNSRGKTFKTFRAWYLNALQLETASPATISQEVMYYGVPIASLFPRITSTDYKCIRKDNLQTQNHMTKSGGNSKQKATNSDTEVSVIGKNSETNKNSNVFFHVHTIDELEMINTDTWALDFSIDNKWIETLDKWN